MLTLARGEQRVGLNRTPFKTRDELSPPHARPAPIQSMASDDLARLTQEWLANRGDGGAGSSGGGHEGSATKISTLRADLAALETGVLERLESAKRTTTSIAGALPVQRQREAGPLPATLDQPPGRGEIGLNVAESVEEDEMRRVRRSVARILVRIADGGPDVSERLRRYLNVVETGVSGPATAQQLIRDHTSYMEACPEARDVCAICLDPLRGGVLKLHACSHAFHFHCIVRWLEMACAGGIAQARCPMCKACVGPPRSGTHHHT